MNRETEDRSVPRFLLEQAASPEARSVTERPSASPAPGPEAFAPKPLAEEPSPPAREARSEGPPAIRQPSGDAAKAYYASATDIESLAEAIKAHAQKLCADITEQAREAATQHMNTALWYRDEGDRVQAEIDGYVETNAAAKAACQELSARIKGKS